MSEAEVKGPCAPLELSLPTPPPLCWCPHGAQPGTPPHATPLPELSLPGTPMELSLQLSQTGDP